MIQYRVKPEFAPHFPIEPEWIVEAFVKAHEFWWQTSGNALCGRQAEMRTFLLAYANPAMTELGRDELLHRADTDRYYVALKFDEFVRDCFIQNRTA